MEYEWNIDTCLTEFSVVYSTYVAVANVKLKCIPHLPEIS